MMGQKVRKETVLAMANSRENRVQNRDESKVSNYTVCMQIMGLANHAHNMHICAFQSMNCHRHRRLPKWQWRSEEPARQVSWHLISVTYVICIMGWIKLNALHTHFLWLSNFHSTVRKWEQSLDCYLFFIVNTVRNDFPDGWWCHCYQQPPSCFLDVSLELRVWVWVRDHSCDHHVHRHVSTKWGKTIRITVQYGIWLQHVISTYACRRDQIATSGALRSSPIRVLTRAV